MRDVIELSRFGKKIVLKIYFFAIFRKYALEEGVFFKRLVENLGAIKAVFISIIIDDDCVRLLYSFPRGYITYP